MPRHAAHAAAAHVAASGARKNKKGPFDDDHKDGHGGKDHHGSSPTSPLTPRKAVVFDDGKGLGVHMFDVSHHMSDCTDEDGRPIAKKMTKEEAVESLKGVSLTLERAQRKKEKPISTLSFAKTASRLILNQTMSKDRSIWTVIYLKPAFENAALFLIVINAVWIGFDIDMNNEENRKLPSAFFEAGESIFCLLFSLELGIRFLAYKNKKDFFRDPEMKNWNAFDLVLVASMIIDTWVLTYVVKKDAGFRAVSTMRLARLLRIARIFRLVPELGTMVKSLLAAVRSVFSTCLLALGVMYIFAIIFLQWAKSYGSQGKCIGDPGYEVCLNYYFGHLRTSFLTLMQVLVFDDTFEIVKPVFNENGGMGFLLVIYICLVSFTLCNMLIGIICDIVMQVTEREELKIRKIRLQELFDRLDVDGSETLSREEFNHYQTPQLLENIGIDQQITRNAFDILDRDRDGELQSKEFVDMICKCLHDPTSSDILVMSPLVDNIAVALGFGREEVAILQKEIEKINSRRSVESSKSDDENDWKPELSIGHFEKAAHLMKLKARVSVNLKPKSPKQMVSIHDRKDMAMTRMTSLYNVSERILELKRSIGDVQLAAEAGKLADVPNADAGQLLMLEDGQANTGDRSQFWSGGVKFRAPLPLPSAGMMTILRPALRALHARLHALRSECKIAGMSFDGNILHSLEWTPLDEIITEVLKCLETASKALQLDSFRTSVASQQLP